MPTGDDCEFRLDVRDGEGEACCCSVLVPLPVRVCVGIAHRRLPSMKPIPHHAHQWHASAACSKPTGTTRGGCLRTGVLLANALR